MASVESTGGADSADLTELIGYLEEVLTFFQKTE